MRPALTYDSLHNPFCNRFNDPVTWRRDEMQAYAHMVWLRERNQGTYRTESNAMAAPSSLIASAQITSTSEPTHWARLFASVIALFLLLLGSAAMLKAF